MATDFDKFKKNHEDAMKRVNEELIHMLPSDLYKLAEYLAECRDNQFQYNFKEVT